MNIYTQITWGLRNESDLQAWNWSLLSLAFLASGAALPVAIVKNTAIAASGPISSDSGGWNIMIFEWWLKRVIVEGVILQMHTDERQGLRGWVLRLNIQVVELRFMLKLRLMARLAAQDSVDAEVEFEVVVDIEVKAKVDLQMPLILKLTLAMRRASSW
jgi:hypothetical protein